jgi:hypothetical protein
MVRVKSSGRSTPNVWGKTRRKGSGGDPVKNLSHLRIRRNLLHGKDAFQIRPPGPLLHPPLIFQETRMLKEQ